MSEMEFRSLGQSYFAELDLGDVRRSRRLASLFDTMCGHPGGTLPNKLPNPADLDAFYRLMRNPVVTHQAILLGHTAATRREMIEASRAGRVVLIIHDATELDYTSLKTLVPDLGQIGRGTNFGYICHNSLAVQAYPQRVIGLTSQILHHRADVPKNETDAQRRERADRESLLWGKGAMQSGQAPAGCLWVDVSDSLSDTFEYMSHEVDQGRSFVLRCRENRKLATPLGDCRYHYDAVRQQTSIATRRVRVQATTKCAARTAEVHISRTPVTINYPVVRLGHYQERPLDLWCVRAWEPNPPTGAEPLEWILMTNVPVHSAEDAIQRVEWYEARWVIEDYHKGMKTGCAIESLQFTNTTSQEPAIAVLSILATTLLTIRDAARQPDASTRPATDVVSPVYVKVLTRHYPTRLSSQPSVLEFYMHVARLGGHQNRKDQGLPGWITLWRGWMKLQLMVTGYEIHTRARARSALT